MTEADLQLPQHCMNQVCLRQRTVITAVFFKLYCIVLTATSRLTGRKEWLDGGLIKYGLRETKSMYL